MVVRRKPWAVVGVLLAGALAGTVGGLTGCNSVNSTAPSGATRVDTLPAFMPYTGTLTNTFGVTNFLGSSEMHVGDIDATNPSVTERGVVTFIINGFEGQTLDSAVLRLDLCGVSGNPFAYGTLNLERLYPVGAPPGLGQNGHAAAQGFGAIATSAADTGFVSDTVTSGVQADLADSAVFEQFRVRLSGDSAETNNGVSDFVDIRTIANGNCAGSAAAQPILILTLKG